MDRARFAAVVGLAVSALVQPAALAVPEPTDFVMDGQRDAGALIPFQNEFVRLSFALRGGKVYVAAEDAGERNDHFIFVARNGGSLLPAPQNKAGGVGMWNAYLFDENDSDFSSWFGAIGPAQSASGPDGGVIEGTLDFLTQFPAPIPTSLRIASGAFGTADGGVLDPRLQMPASLQNNGDIEFTEYGFVPLPVGWVQEGQGNWNNHFNWAIATPDAVGATAIFGNGVRGPTTAIINTPITVKTINFNTAFPITIAGSEILTLDSVAGFVVLTVNSGRHEISAPLVLNEALSLSVFGAERSMTLSGPISYAAGTESVHSGTGSVTMTGPVTAGAGAKLLVIDGTTTAHIDLNGLGVQVDSRLVMNTSQHVSSLNVKRTGKATLSDVPMTSVLRAAELTVLGKFDIADNGFVLDYTGASPMKSIYTAVMAGQTATQPNGFGIYSENALATPNRAVGYAEAASIGSPAMFLGEAIDNTAVLVRYTINGDANLSGGVDITDFSMLAANFNHAGVWSDGDFNYDSTTNIADFAILAANFNQSLPQPRTAVPEPAVAGLFAMTGLILVRRFVR